MVDLLLVDLWFVPTHIIMLCARACRERTEVKGEGQTEEQVMRADAFECVRMGPKVELTIYRTLSCVPR